VLPGLEPLTWAKPQAEAVAAGSDVAQGDRVRRAA